MFKKSKNILCFMIGVSLLIGQFSTSITVFAGDYYFNENFETYTDVSKMIPKWNKIPSASSEGVTTGEIVSNVENILSMETKAIKFSVKDNSGGAAFTDNNIAIDGKDMSGKVAMHIKIKPEDLNGEQYIIFRYQKDAQIPAIFVFPFQILKGKASSFGVTLTDNGSDIVIPSGKWLDAVIEYDSVLLQANITLSGSVNKIINIDLTGKINSGFAFYPITVRYGVKHYYDSANPNGSTIAYFDDIFIQKESRGFANFKSIPADSSIGVDKNTAKVKLDFETIMAKDTLNKSNITVLKDSGLGYMPVDNYEILNCSTSCVLNFDSPLGTDAEYKINVSTNVKDYWQKAIDEKNTVFSMESSNKNNQIPNVEITYPVNNKRIDPGNDLTITANAVDSDGSIKRVEFFNGNIKLGEVLEEPYSFVWRNVPAGNYTITAKATDNLNSKNISTPVQINCGINIPPVINVLSPLDGTIFAYSDPVTVSLDVTDPNGENITLVKLYKNDYEVASFTKPPYTYTLTGLEEGVHNIYAEAYDESGAKTISKYIQFKVVKVDLEGIKQETFDAYTLPETYETFVQPTGWPSIPNKGKIFSTQVDATHGRSVVLQTNENTGTISPYISYPLSRTGGIYIFEAELMFKDYGANRPVFTIKSNGSPTQWMTNITFDTSGKIIAEGVSASQIGTYQTNKWYNVKMVANFNELKYDFYVDNEALVTQKAFQNSLCNSIYDVRITHHGVATTKSETLLDNFKISKVNEPPYVSDITFIDSQGNEFSDTNIVPLDTKNIGIKFSVPINAQYLNDETIQFKKNGIKVNAIAKYDTNSKMYVFTLGKPLASLSDYIITVSSGIKSDSGKVLNFADQMRFRTVSAPFDILSTAFKTGETEVTSLQDLSTGSKVTFRALVVNETQAEKKVLVSIVLYKNDVINDIVTKSYTISPNQQNVIVETVPITWVDNSTNEYYLSGYVWDQYATRMPLTSHKILQ